MKNNINIGFATYFNQAYLQKGLAMIDSFCKFNPSHKIYVLCFDQFTYNYLKKYRRNETIPIKLSNFEDTDLLRAKKNRNKVEYYWTCTPSLPLFVLNNNKELDMVFYLDADLYFFDSVEKILSEFDQKSVYTVEHRYPKGQEGRENTSGRFNVAFQIFRKDKEGISCLNRWRNQCIDWCYWKEEDGKMGDQMYLNEWPKLYKNLCISQNLGVDTAPWNIGQYNVTKKNKKIYINNDKLICYHFHQLKILGKNRFEYASGYRFSNNVVKYIYRPYSKDLTQKLIEIQKNIPDYKIPIIKIPIIVQLKNIIAPYVGPIYWKLLKKDA